MALLDPALMQRLKLLTLRSRRRAAGTRAGERRSIRRGQSQEFADHRPYVRGDDLRFLDWHLFARLDTLWVKLFEEEQDRTVQVLLDSSASMEGEKLEYARQIAAAIGFVALGRSDRVLVAGLTDALAHYSPPRRGMRNAVPLFSSLEAVHPGGQTDLARALAAMPRQRGGRITLLFTDLLYPDGAEAPLRRLVGTGGEVHLFHVLSPWELRPDLEGDLVLVDAETGEELAVSMSPAALDRYEATVREWLDEVESTARRLGIAYHRLVTSVPVEEVILTTLRTEGVLA